MQAVGLESGIGIELELTTTQYVFLKSLKSWLWLNRRQELPASPWDGSLNKSSDLQFALWTTFNGENWGGFTWSQCQPYIKLGTSRKWFLASSLPPQAWYLPFLRLPSISTDGKISAFNLTYAQFTEYFSSTNSLCCLCDFGSLLFLLIQYIKQNP